MSNNGNQIAERQPPSVLADMAARFGMDKRAFEATLSKTIMPNGTSQEQTAAFLVVAKQYDLNPFTKEIFAFPSNGGIQPVVSIDGWLKIINSHPQFDGMEFEDKTEDGALSAVTCRIFRKDRKHPVAVTEYMAECKRPTSTWKQWPARMLRHKAAIQCARYAFGFAGIYDPDEAERIREAQEMGEARIVEPEQAPQYPQEDFDANFESWAQIIRAGQRSAEDLIAMIETKGELTDGMKQSIRSIKQKPAVSAPNAEALPAMMDEAGWREKDLADQVGADDIDSMSAEQRAQAAELLESAE